MGRVSTTEHFGVRKGAWTEEEDILLRKCIEKFGEGKWRQVPMRAGLRRCRKSCRLRWLNHLKPNLKKGEFQEDEVDLLIRLHKLLGNRWSLISGRLPGRTANDIKNYWNSYLSKRISRQTKGVQQIPSSTTSKVIKPQARTFSPNSKWLLSGNGSVINTRFQPQQISNETTPQEEETMSWWKSLLAELDKAEEGKEEGKSQLRSGEGGLQEEFRRSSAEVQEMEKMEKEKEKEGDELIVEGGLGEWDNMLLDVNLWGILDQ